MITIPTGEFTGLLSDVIPFACPDVELAWLNVVHLEWDGEVLHALTTDLMRVAWCQWHPDDDPPAEDQAQDDIFVHWGGADEPWKLDLPLADAAELVKIFKLKAKQQRVPLTLDVDFQRISVERNRESGHSEITATMRGVPVDFPDVRATLAKNDVIQPVMGLAFTAAWLADFASVRPRGPLEMKFTGPKSLTHVQIGERFIGAIMPVRIGPGPKEPSDRHA